MLQDIKRHTKREVSGDPVLQHFKSTKTSNLTSIEVSQEEYLIFGYME